MRKLQEPKIDEGWSVHVYDRQRRLLYVLDPSHRWTFLVGCIVGISFALVGVNLVQNQSAPEPVRSTDTPKLEVD